MARRNKKIDEIDMQLASMIYQLRVSSGMSRMQLAEQIDVTHQQLQKYEKGTNRISFGRLYYIAKALKKPISYFADGFADQDFVDCENKRMAMEVSRNFMKIKSLDVRSNCNRLVKSLAG